jgi:hypothetical protein
MPAATFDNLRRDLEAACGFLQSFTQGHRGYTREDGLAGIVRLRGLCDRMEEGFTSGPHAGAAAGALAAGEARIAEAKARLDLLLR